MTLRRRIVIWAPPAALLATGQGLAAASGYLPLHLEPEVERQVERVLILANEPILKRPFAVELVEAALPEACEVDPPLCEKVKRYLERYSRDYALTHASATGTYAHGGKNDVVPNEHGLPLDSHYDVSAQGFVQPSDYLIASAGAITYSGRTQPTGSMLTLGFSGLQIDAGFRDHWWSPATDSSQLQSSESPTRPSITISNWRPLTRFGFQYEIFWEQMSSSDHILGGGQGTTKESRGTPKLFGAQASIEPLSGWSIGVNRTFQYGGGGLPDSAHFLFNDFIKPRGASQTLGNQEASYVTRYIMPAKTPVAVYFQYAGENSLDGGDYLLGEASLTTGIDFPRIWRHFDLTYEISEWQNGWYVNNPFLDGMVNNGLVTGNWGGDQRSFGDGVGARSQMLRIGWTPPFGGYLEERVRELQNQSYAFVLAPSLFGPPPPYRHYIDGMIRYSRPYRGLTVGGEVDTGHDVFGSTYTRLSGFVRYGGDSRTRDLDAADEGYEEADHAKPGTELFVNAGINVNRVKINLEPNLPVEQTPTEVGPHIGLGVRRAVSEKNDLGVQLEADERVDGHLLLGARIVDWRRRLTEHFAVGTFVGVDRYDVATPAYSLYTGLQTQWVEILPKWDLGFDFRSGLNVARNHVLSTDVQGARVDTFYRIESGVLYLTRRF